MPKLPRVPRVSIVIPLQRDEKLFEETLLSVLENQTEECQIVAAHNGTYSDPFDLSDEITFVTARSSNLVDLVRDAFDATTAPIVHVLGTGMNANEGWLCDALGCFDECEVAAVTPTLADRTASIIGGSGWSDVAGRLCQPNRGRQTRSTQGGDGVGNNGFFLNAFFIRRRLLGDLLDAVAPAMNDPVAVSYAMGCLLNRGGWKIISSTECLITADNAPELPDESDSDRGQCLGAIRSRVLPGAPSLHWMDLLRTALLGGSSLGEMIGLIRHQGAAAAIRRAIDPECVSTVDALARVINLDVDADARRAAA